MSAQTKPPPIEAMSSPRSVAEYRDDPFKVLYTSDGRVRVAVSPAHDATRRDRDTDIYMTPEAMEQHAEAARAYAHEQALFRKDVHIEGLRAALLWVDHWIEQHVPPNTDDLWLAQHEIRSALERLDDPFFPGPEKPA